MKLTAMELSELEELGKRKDRSDLKGKIVLEKLKNLKDDEAPQGYIKREEHDIIVCKLNNKLNRALSEVRVLSIEVGALLQEVRDLKKYIESIFVI